MPLLLNVDIEYKEPSTIVRIAELGTWGIVGGLVHGFAAGISERKSMQRPYLYAIWATMFVGIGYFARTFEKSSLQRLEKERDRLVLRRIQRMEKENVSQN